MTNAEARFNNSLRPRKPEGSLGWTAQDVHLDSDSSWTMTVSLIYQMPFQETPEHFVCGQNSKYYKHVAKFYSSYCLKCKFGWKMVFFVAFHNISCTVMTCHCTNQTRSPKRKAVGAKGKGRLSATFVPYRKKSDDNVTLGKEMIQNRGWWIWFLDEMIESILTTSNWQ